MQVHRVLSPVLPQLHFAASPESGRGCGWKAEKVVATPTFVDTVIKEGRGILTSNLQESAHLLQETWAPWGPLPLCLESHLFLLGSSGGEHI